MYDKTNFGIEGLSTWQLIKNVYDLVLSESISLSSLALSDGVLAPSDKIRRMSVMSTSRNKLERVISYLESLLIPEEEFSSNMASLYDWYRSKLAEVVDERLPLEFRKKSAEELLSQARGFVDIWGGVKRA